MYTEYISKLNHVLSRASDSDLKLLKDSIKNCKGNIYILGNGGSSAIASHACNDLMKMCNKVAFCLTDNTPTFSAFANDDGYDQSFLKQLEILLKKDDLVIYLSTSGNSMNILRGYNFSKNVCKNICIHGLSSKNSFKDEICLESTNTQILEDCFQVLFHWCVSECSSEYRK